MFRLLLAHLLRLGELAREDSRTVTVSSHTLNSQDLKLRV